MPSPENVNSSWPLYRRLLSRISPYKGIFAVSAVSMMLTALSEASFAALLKPIMDSGFVDPDPDFIAWVPWLIMLITLIRAGFGFLAAYTMAWVGRQIIFDLRKEMFARLVYLPSRFYDDNSSASLVSKLIYDVEQAASATTDALTAAVRDALSVVALIAWLLYLDWRLTLVFLVVAPMIAWGISYASTKFRRFSERIQDSMSGIAQVVKEAVNGHKLVKTFGAQQYEIETFETANQYNRRKSMGKASVAAIVGPAMMVLFGIALTVVVYMSIKGGTVTAGTFVSYVTAVLMLVSPLQRLAKVNEKIQMGVAAANSMFSTIDEETEHDTGTLVLGEIRGNLVFEDVTFSYTKQTEPALKNVNVEIEAGHTVALVGPSGSGKSTMASLILGLYRPDSGRVLLDGTDITEVTLASLREQVAIVTQETTLFDDTVRANITYGSPVETPQHLQDSIDAAHATEFIERLPDRLDTRVGERGVKLSGGQRQRIAIARALYKNAPILILDEATSSLDSVSERSVQQATENLIMQRTTVVIAHRLSTVEKADQILVMDRGEVVERGRHNELISRKGLYERLYRAQLMDEERVA